MRAKLHARGQRLNGAICVEQEVRPLAPREAIRVRSRRRTHRLRLGALLARIVAFGEEAHAIGKGRAAERPPGAVLRVGLRAWLSIVGASSYDGSERRGWVVNQRGRGVEAGQRT